MDFFLFILLNATLFIRPGELIPDLAGVPIYNGLIVANLLFALPKFAARLAPGALRSSPISACVIGLAASVFASQLARGDLFLARQATFDFAKSAAYYFLLIAVVDTAPRLRGFLGALVGSIALVTTLALLHYHGIVEIPALEAYDEGWGDLAGEAVLIRRLRTTGIYNDPNDLSLLLILGIGSCLFLWSPRPRGLPRPWWLAPAGLFLYALGLTQSRGGFLALLAGMVVLFHGRYGAKVAGLLGGLALPAMFLLFGGRQTSIDTSGDTGQDRIQLWAEGFAMLRESPLFGVGHGEFAERAGLVAHNSFVHAYAELGLAGGTLFLGSFAYASKTLEVLKRHPDAIGDGEVGRLRPYLLAMVVAYAFGMLTISRNYVVPTYMVLGMASAYFRLVALGSPRLAGPGGPIAPLDRRLVGRSILAGSAFLIVANLFIKLAIR